MGLCEIAEGGTLFLDEIGETDIATQSKLLRFLQDFSYHRVGGTRFRRANVRIVSATNQPPDRLIREGRFREDLYYRLNLFPVEVPPLRLRAEDIPQLAQYFVQSAARRYKRDVVGLSQAVLRTLESHHWPGNVRQLKNVVERMVILSEGRVLDTSVLPQDLLAEPRSGHSFSRSERQQLADRSDALRPIDEIEHQALLDALCEADGNVVRASQMLGIGPATAYRKIKRYGIDLKQTRQTPPRPPAFRDARLPFGRAISQPASESGDSVPDRSPLFPTTGTP